MCDAFERKGIWLLKIKENMIYYELDTVIKKSQVYQWSLKI